MGRGDVAEGLFSITELADELGVTPRAIRFYEAKGLLEPQRAGATRVYSNRDRARQSQRPRGLLRAVCREGRRWPYRAVCGPIGEQVDVYVNKR